MELKIQPIAKPAPIVWNYEELKTELATKLDDYKHLQYSPEQMTEAKADRARLNSFKKALNEERIRREKDYLEPFSVFKAQVTELCGMIDEPVHLIDAQIKQVEENEKEEKKAKCETLFSETKDMPEWVKFEQVFDPKWLNKTTSGKFISDALEATAKKINDDVQVIQKMPCWFEALEEYKQNLDLAKAIAEGEKQLEVQKKKMNAVETSETPQIPFVGDEVIEITADEEKGKENRVWLSFKAYLSKDEALDLKSFFNLYSIQYEAIKEDK